MQGISAATASSDAAQNAPQPRLVKAAHEFEAQMMKELLKPMTSTDGLTGTDDDSDSGSNGALGQFASEALGRSLSEHGGLGIAKSVLSDLSRTGGHSAAKQVSGQPASVARS